MEITNCDVFMAHIPHKDIDKIVECITGYECVVSYLIGMETADTVGEHMHFIVETKGKGWYHKFSKRVFKDWYNLNGKAHSINGVSYPRQYGKLNKIKDMEKMYSYTVKDQNLRTNMSQSVIDKYVEKSYKKSESRDYTLQLLKKIDDFDKTIYPDYVSDKKAVRKVKPWDSLTQREKIHEEFEYPKHRKQCILIYIIKLLKEKNVESITKGQIDSYWNKWTSTRWTADEIYLDRYHRY